MKILNKNIIIAIIVVIIIAAAAAFVFGVGKTQTQISIVNNETFQNGEQVEIVLKDAQGNAIAGQSIEITFKGNEKLTVTTDNNGKGYLLRLVRNLCHHVDDTCVVPSGLVCRENKHAIFYFFQCSCVHIFIVVFGYSS